MMRQLLITILTAIVSLTTAVSQTPAWAKETESQKQKRMEWWTNDRLGMFIHFGLYAMPARHEWVMSNEKISREDYARYFERFDPDLYDPGEWARKAREAGMKYVVITTKHHDGFCLWDTSLTDFKVTNTPYGKDIIGPLVDAFRAEGIRIGFYYSLIDWRHADFTVDRIHPERSDDKQAVEAANKGRSMERYRAYLRGQITELLTGFGRIDELFLDFSYPGEGGKGREDWDSEGLLALIRSLQPHIIVDNRLDLDHTDWGWDFVTPEQFMPREWPEVRGRRVPWETCQTFSGSWGYHRDEHSWKSVGQLITMLAETVSKGGNLLLNVGPTARGAFDQRATDRLSGIAEWMRLNSRSIYGCTQPPSIYETPDNCLTTYNPITNRLYIHILDWPIKSLHLKGYEGKVAYAQLLSDASEIKITTNPTPGSHTTETTSPGDSILTRPLPPPPHPPPRRPPHHKEPRP
ncbi:MAG: alpha-L-fucosidase, partial [Tannerellaceae bacterium]|nr:alpha-L-fucosidase [Tannerellaceae bacterium]